MSYAKFPELTQIKTKDVFPNDISADAQEFWLTSSSSSRAGATTKPRSRKPRVDAVYHVVYILYTKLYTG